MIEKAIQSLFDQRKILVERSTTLNENNINYMVAINELRMTIADIDNQIQNLITLNNE